MPEHASPGPVRRPGRLGWIALLPGVLIGFLPRRVDAGDNAGVAGRGVFLAEHLRQSQ